MLESEECKPSEGVRSTGQSSIGEVQPEVCGRYYLRQSPRPGCFVGVAREGTTDSMAQGSLLVRTRFSAESSLSSPFRYPVRQMESSHQSYDPRRLWNSRVAGNPLFPQSQKRSHGHRPKLLVTHFDAFEMHWDALGRCLGCRVKSGRSQDIVNVEELSASVGDSQPILVIHAIVQGFVEGANSFGDRGTPKHCWLTKTGIVRESGEGKRLGGVKADSFPEFIDILGPTIDDINFGIFLEITDNPLDSHGGKYIIGVEICAQFPLRSRQTFIDGVGLTSVSFRNPPDLVRKVLENRTGVVGRTTVDHDIVNVWIRLG